MRHRPKYDNPEDAERGRLRRSLRYIRSGKQVFLKREFRPVFSIEWCAKCMAWHVKTTVPPRPSGSQR